MFKMNNKVGIFSAIAASALWGTSYVLPAMLGNYNAVEVTLGRYLIYGVISLYLLIKPRLLFKLSKKIWKKAFLFAITGNIVYYFFEVIGIKMLLPSIVVLIFCFMPLSISLYGNLKHKEYPWYYLISIGVVVIFGLLLTQIDAYNIGITWDKQTYLGFLFTIISVFMWSHYAVNNASYLKKQTVNITVFTSMIGVCCLGFCFLACLMNFIKLIITNEHNGIIDLIKNYLHMDYILACTFLGIGVTWFGTVFWNHASANLPITLAGQIVTAEIIFGLLFSYIFEKRMPGIYEATGILLVIAAITYFFITKTKWGKVKEEAY